MWMADWWLCGVVGLMAGLSPIHTPSPVVWSPPYLPPSYTQPNQPTNHPHAPSHPPTNIHPRRPTPPPPSPPPPSSCASTSSPASRRRACASSTASWSSPASLTSRSVSPSVGLPLYWPPYLKPLPPSLPPLPQVIGEPAAGGGDDDGSFDRDMVQLVGEVRAGGRAQTRAAAVII